MKIFLCIWFGGVILIGGMAFLTAIRQLLFGVGGVQNPALAIAVLPVMLAVGYGFVRLGRYIARDEARFLTDFLIRTLDARAQNAG